jgi:hypothetical protein
MRIVIQRQRTDDISKLLPGGEFGILTDRTWAA